MSDDDVEMLSDLEESKFLREKVKPETSSDASGTDTDEGGDHDSDRELQIAFKKGLLKPGLNYAVDAPRGAINDTAAMKQKLVDFKQSISFPERLDLIPAKTQLMNKHKEKKHKSVPKNNDLSDSAQPLTEMEDIDDDFKREMAFCHVAQMAVLEMIPRLQTAGVVTKRPEDYFAEMAKSDTHMQRIREKLVQKKAEIEGRNRARQLRQLRKESKYIQEEVLKRRQAEKKLLNETAKKYSNDAKSKQDLEEMLAGKKKGQQPPQKKKTEPVKVNKRREWKNKKFGYGGQKKRSKWNTAESVDDYSKRKKSTSTFARVNRNSGRRLTKQRPSKTARAQSRGNRAAAGGRKR